MPSYDFPIMLRTGFICIVLALGACASNDSQSDDETNNDPWEPINRPLHAVNDTLDTIIVRPVAKGYEFIVPAIMRQGVGNFSQNLRTPLNVITNLLQGKGSAAINEVGRFVTNSTIGVLGIFDVATATGLPARNEDFGQTLAVWGVPAGPYVVVPFLGPRTLRSVFVIPLNFLADPLFHYRNSSVRDKIYALRLLDVRQRLFKAEDLIKDSPDQYIAIRGAYLQHREFEIYDGNPPEDDSFYEDFPEDED